MRTDLDRLSATLDGIEDEIGRRAKRRRRSKRGNRIGVSGRKLVRKQYTKDRGFLLSLGFRHAYPDPPGFNVTFIASPQVPVRPRRLVLNDWGELVFSNYGTMRQWVVTEIKIANKSQFVDGGAAPFPASAFVPDASEVLFKFDSCGPGEEILVSLAKVNAPYIISDANNPQLTAGMIVHAADR